MNTKILLLVSLLLTFYVSDCYCKAKPEEEESQDEISEDYLQHLDIHPAVIHDLNNNGGRQKLSVRNYVEVAGNKTHVRLNASTPAQSKKDIGSNTTSEGGRPVRSNLHDHPPSASDAKLEEVSRDKKSLSSDDLAPALSENIKESVIYLEQERINLAKQALASAPALAESNKKSVINLEGDKRNVLKQEPASAPALSESKKKSIINLEGDKRNVLKQGPASAPALSERNKKSVINLEQERSNLVEQGPASAPALSERNKKSVINLEQERSNLVEQVPASAPALSENNKKSVIDLEGDKRNVLKQAPASVPNTVDEAAIEQEGVDSDNVNSRPKNLPEAIKKEEPLAPGNKKDDSNVAPLAKASPVVSEDAIQADKQTESKPNSFALFTIANTNTGITYAQLPYREKYQWQDTTAPCHSFQLKIPDELAEKSLIKLCIFRPNLEFPDETNLFLLNENGKDKSSEQTVMGFVVDSHGSLVHGRIENGMFYGEISIIDPEKNLPTIFVIEDINLLNGLMRYNPKTLRHMLMVMQAPDKSNVHTHGKQKPLVYNAVVTKGASLISFMSHNRAMDANRSSFLMFTTSHNSYISSGEPQVKVDDQGVVRLELGKNNILVRDDGSIKINIPDKEYTFRPHGRTIIKEGMVVRTLQEHEGSVAITAYSSSSTYDCVLPTPALQPKRKGGYLCKVCLALDDTFQKYYVERMVPKDDDDLGQHYLGRIIDRVSWIFRSMDLDGDMKPDNIGLDYEDHSVHWTYPDIGGEDVSEQDIEVLFQSLEDYNFADCCLGIGFTMKNFPKDVLGKRTQAKSGPSGVCAGKTGRVANNLIIMSANNKSGNYSHITEDQLIYATANQIAGAFGAKPDGTGNDLCDQFVDQHQMTRHHLMWPDVMRNTTLCEQSLSSCSKVDIIQVLTTCKSSCFDIDQHPFCGNGIVEEGEECDCGSEVNCLAQSCCFSRMGTYPCRKTGMGCTSGSASLYSTGVISYLGIVFLAFMRHLLSP